MAKKQGKEAADDEEASKGGKLKLVVGAVVLLMVGIVLGGKVLAGGSSATASDMVTTTTTEPPGIVTTLDAITLNLADGRFLKLGLAFEVRDGENYPDPDQAAADTISKGFARELDVAITTMSTFTYEDLVAPNGKTNAKRMLLEEVQRVSDDAIKDVLFHEFVMQ